MQLTEITPKRGGTVIAGKKGQRVYARRIASIVNTQIQQEQTYKNHQARKYPHQYPREINLPPIYTRLSLRRPSPPLRDYPERHRARPLPPRATRSTPQHSAPRRPPRRQPPEPAAVTRTLHGEIKTTVPGRAATGGATASAAVPPLRALLGPSLVKGALYSEGLGWRHVL